jgi:hypothetical protein
MALPPTITDASVTLTFGAAGVYYGYCTIADVDYEFPNKASFATLTNSVVAQAITYAGQELQQLIEHFYQMPYVGSDGGILLTLRQMNAWLATANLIDRYFQGNEPDLSPAGKERRSWAELKVEDLVNGSEQWGPPFGDAVPMVMKPVYDLSTGATISPNPGDLNPNNASPIFSIGLTRFRSDMM